MPARRKSAVPRALASVTTGVRSDANRAKRAKIGGKRAATKRWRRRVRPQILRSAVAATESLPWSPALLEVLFEELYVEDSLKEVLGSRARELQKRQYPQAIAVALVLRHSWQPEDLACNSALQNADTTVFKLTGRDSFADRTATVEQFRQAGGLLVGTDGGISEGIELGDVPHVVHYDLPLSAEAVEQRRGRVDRYGRTGPLTMYVFLDDSGAIPSEVEASDRLNALRSAVKSASALTDHVDTDGPVSH